MNNNTNGHVPLENLRDFEVQFFKNHQERLIASQVLSDDDINAKYLKGEIRIVTEQARYPLSSVSDMFSGGDYILMPEFQRRHRWDVKKQSKLIESFIMNVPVPPIFLYESDFSVYEVMDGLQRITAIIEFYADKYALEGLDLWRELNGKKYSELPEQIKRGIDRRYISSIILLKETAKTSDEAGRMKQLVFSRINSGGAKLEDQEFRNSQYTGKFNNMIREVARNPYFCEIFDIPQRTEEEDLLNDKISDELKENLLFSKMKDVENVLRFFAMRNIQAWGGGTLTKFLDQISCDGQTLPDNAIATYKELFENTIKLAYDLYGELAFKLRKKYILEDGSAKWRWNGTPNMVVYDPIMVALSNNIERKDELMFKKEDIIEETKKLFEENEPMWNGRNTSKSYVEQRILAFESLYNNVL